MSITLKQVSIITGNTETEIYAKEELQKYLEAKGVTVEDGGYPITMTEERKQRVVERCKTQMKHSGKELNMHTKNCHIFSRKPAAVLAVVVICLSLSAAALAGIRIAERKEK